MIDPNSTKPVALVSCVGKKLDSAAPAQDLYQSAWFLKARRHVESEKLQWFILSAEHGLVSPHLRIAPYDKTLNEMPAAECKKWAQWVFCGIRLFIPTASPLQIYAGDRYRKYLLPLLQESGYTFEVPLQGLGIGEQLAWFDRSCSD